MHSVSVPRISRVEQIFYAGIARNGRNITVDGLSAPGGRIFFRESALNWQNMIHEVLHQISGLTDEAMLLELGKDPAGPSKPISDAIKDKCK
jgi:hypothetical protein